MSAVPPLHAIVLAGGTGRRLGGASKPDIRVGGRTLLALTLDSLPEDVSRVVVVAPAGVDVPQGVGRTLEDPPLGGPASGVAAGWHHLEALGTGDQDLVALLACDAPRSGRALPQLSRVLLRSSRRGAPGDGPHEVALARSGGRVQFLPALLSARALAALCSELGGRRDVSMRRLLAGASWLEVDMDPRVMTDIDDWDDLRRFSGTIGGTT